MTTNYRVQMSNGGVVKVTAETKEAAAAAALAVVEAAETRRAAIVTASGGPEWARKVSADVTVVAIRKAPARRA